MKITTDYTSTTPSVPSTPITPGGPEESEFDSDAIIVPPLSEDQMDEAKPRLKGKKLTTWPPMKKDSELSGLCSIM